MLTRVGIFDSDKRYLEKLGKFFGSHYKEEIELRVFSNRQTLLNHLGTAGRIDVLLIPLSCDPAEFTQFKGVKVAFLTEDPSEGRMNGYDVIKKYQRVDQIYRFIKAIDIPGKDFEIHSVSTSRLLVYMGAGGGVGTTTVAIASACKLARRGNKVLYLNTEENGYIGSFFPIVDNGTLSDILYGISTIPNITEGLVNRVHGIIQTKDGVDYIAPLNMTDDYMLLMKSDIKKVIRLLDTACKYDFVIVDTDCARSELRDILIDIANMVIMVSDGFENANGKMIRRLDEFERIEEREGLDYLKKIQILYNRFGSGAHGAKLPRGIKPIGTIKRIVGSDYQKLVDTISNEDAIGNIVNLFQGA